MDKYRVYHLVAGKVESKGIMTFDELLSVLRERTESLIEDFPELNMKLHAAMGYYRARLIPQSLSDIKFIPWYEDVIKGYKEPEKSYGIAIVPV